MGQPAADVDGDVDPVPADAPVAMSPFTAEHAVATSGADASQHLRVQVDQLAGALALAAHLRWPGLEAVQASEPLPAQEGVHRGAGEPGLPCQHVRADPELPPTLAQPLDHPRRMGTGLAMDGAGVVDGTIPALPPVPADPLVDRSHSAPRSGGRRCIQGSALGLPSTRDRGIVDLHRRGRLGAWAAPGGQHDTRCCGCAGVEAACDTDPPGLVTASVPASAERSGGRLATAWSRLPGWRTALVVAAISRILVIVPLVVFNRPSSTPELVGAGPLNIYDGAWYLSIAHLGYHAEPLVGAHADFSFFPTWPLLIRVASLDGLIDAAVLAPILAIALYLMAVPLLWRVLAQPFGDQAATWGLVFLSLSPASYVLSLSYSEPLFLLLTAIAFATPMRSRRRLIATALVAATRLPGIAVGASGLALLRRDPAHAISAVAAGAMGLFAWIGFVGVLTSDGLGFFRGTFVWWSSLDQTTGPSSALHAIVTFPQPAPLLAVLASSWMAVLLLSCLGGLRRASPQLALYSGLVVLIALNGQWVNWPRLALPAFPILAFWAFRTGPRGRIAIASALAVSQLMLASLASYGYLTP